MIITNNILKYCPFCKDMMHSDYSFAQSNISIIYYCFKCEFRIDLLKEKIMYLKYHYYEKNSDEYIVFCANVNNCYTGLYKRIYFYDYDESQNADTDISLMFTINDFILPKSLNYEDLETFARKLIKLNTFS